MAPTVREIIAKRILEVAKTGERDPTRLCEQALGFKEEGHNRFATQGRHLDGEWGSTDRVRLVGTHLREDIE